MTRARPADYRLQRLDAIQLTLLNAWDIPVRLFAGEDVPVERAAVTELVELLRRSFTAERPPTPGVCARANSR